MHLFFYNLCCALPLSTKYSPFLPRSVCPLAQRCAPAAGCRPAKMASGAGPSRRREDEGEEAEEAAKRQRMAAGLRQPQKQTTNDNKYQYLDLSEALDAALSGRGELINIYGTPPNMLCISGSAIHRCFYRSAFFQAVFILFRPHTNQRPLPGVVTGCTAPKITSKGNGAPHCFSTPVPMHPFFYTTVTDGPTDAPPSIRPDWHMTLRLVDHSLASPADFAEARRPPALAASRPPALPAVPPPPSPRARAAARGAAPVRSADR